MENAVLESISNGIQLVAPEAWLLVVATLIFLVAPFLPKGKSGESSVFWPSVSIFALMVAMMLWMGGGVSTKVVAAAPFRADPLSYVVKAMGFGSGILLLLMGWSQFSGKASSEMCACLLFIVAGINLVGCANDLVTLFVSLELISIPTYILLYASKHDLAGNEAATKYFLLSVFSSAILLYGLSFFYGSVGTTNLAVLQGMLREAKLGELSDMLMIGVLMVVAGLGFRVTAVPFHFYAPDVFAGTTTTSAALMAYVPKVAGFVAMARLLSPLSQSFADGTLGTSMIAKSLAVIWSVATLTMFVGNVLALLQHNIKRLLAYSSIAHAGYMLVAISALGTENGLAALGLYLVAYGVMTLGVFAVLAMLERDGSRMDQTSDLAGLAKSQPLLAFMMAVFLFSLTGLPPTAGFMGKFNILLVAGRDGSSALMMLAVMMAINAAIGGWYYLRLISLMYFSPATRMHEARSGLTGWLSVGLCSFGTLLLFFVPRIVWDLLKSVSA